ncbi:MAG: response regulator [Rhodospirillaceae bacterium]|jgi:two-component system, chemotaxis family, chemotaxis protein CheY|nr:response regulator [Rhodospirillaceae bacterium]MBT4489138.1 response regulator [Rhodospirillaceae bacterium]MBT5192325.1 response regulator [Rhodospirillaceae bacterium]MBT5894770.1 response regulator [Rhodospirillaceae bacterium]MBT7757557.1 response regulator [Rhodospirillaceae bacterium]
MTDKITTGDALSSINVMVVDDEEIALRILSVILCKLGISNVVTARDGADALEKLASSDATIDIIISDIEMPRIDGYEFVRKVRLGAVPKYKEVPILILTGRDTDENLQKARFHKIDGFIVKPPHARDLDRKIRQALGL